MINFSRSTATIPVTEILPHRSLFSGLNLREVWQYRDLFYFLLWRDVKAQYAQSVLGVGWALIRPVFTMLVFTVIFGKLAKINSDGLPYAIFSLAAVVPWSYFSSALSASSASLGGATNLVQKVYVPRIIIPLAPVVSKLIDFAISFVMLAALMAYFRVVPTWWALCLPGLLLIAMLAASGVGMMLTSLAVQYRDVKHMLGFAVQLMVYLSPVVYPVSLVPPQYRLLYGLNPMAGVIEGFRSSLLGSVPMPWDLLGVGSLVALALFVAGLTFFHNKERYFADVA